MNQDFIQLEHLPLEVRVGVLEHEQGRFQRVLADLRLFLDLETACRTDELSRTVDYAQLAQGIGEYTKTRHWNLIETLAKDLIQWVLDSYPVTTVEILLRKPEAFGDGTVPAVFLRRSR